MSWNTLYNDFKNVCYSQDNKNILIEFAEFSLHSKLECLLCSSLWGGFLP
jgi:hypothetical protein